MASSSSSSSTTPTQPTTGIVGLSTGRSLRDSLTVLESCLPKKKRRCIGGSVDEDENENEDGGNGKDLPPSKSIERRSEDERNSVKKCLNEMIPFIYSKKRPRIGSYLETEKGVEGDNTIGQEKKGEKGDKDEEAQRQAAATTSTITNTTTTDDDNKKSTEYNVYAEKLKKLKKENNNIQKRKERIIHRYANLVYSYEYGLKAVSKLNDLTSAPDNVMRGNDRIETIFE